VPGQVPEDLLKMLADSGAEMLSKIRIHTENSALEMLFGERLASISQLEPRSSLAHVSVGNKTLNIETPF
jgi:hypothetical protein